MSPALYLGVSFILIFLILICLVLILFQIFSPRTPRGPFPYRRAELLDKREQALFTSLRAFSGQNELALLVKLPLSALVLVPPDTREHAEWTARLKGRRADFVLCEPAQMRVLLVVQLDKKGKGKREADENEFITQLCEAAGIRLLLVKDQKAEELRDALYQMTGIAEKKPAAQAKAPA